MAAAAMSHIVVLTLVLNFGSQASTVKWRLVTLPALPNLHRGSDGFVPTVALIPSFDTIAAWLRNQSESEEFGPKLIEKGRAVGTVVRARRQLDMLDRVVVFLTRIVASKEQRYLGKTLPEAQRTQDIESKT